MSTSDEHKNYDYQNCESKKARVYIVNCQQQKFIANLGLLYVNCFFSEIELNCSHNSLQFDLPKQNIQ